MVLSEINSINKKFEKIDIKKLIFSSFVDLQDNLTVSEEKIKGRFQIKIWEITKIKNETNLAILKNSMHNSF